jgi:hypothetical protein
MKQKFIYFKKIELNELYKNNKTKYFFRKKIGLILNRF